MHPVACKDDLHLLNDFTGSFQDICLAIYMVASSVYIHKQCSTFIYTIEHMDMQPYKCLAIPQCL